MLRRRLLSATLSALREAPFDPARWTAALDGAAALCNASSAQLLAFGYSVAPVVMAPGFTADDIAQYVALEGPNPARNKGVDAIMKAPLFRPVSVYEYMTERERSRDPLYQEFFEPHDGAFPAFGVIARNGGVSAALNLLRHSTQGPLDDEGRRALSQLLPHFQRAFTLQHRMEQEATAVAGGTLDAVHLAAFLCDVDGRVRGLTSRAERLLKNQSLLRQRDGRIYSSSPETETSFMMAICRAARAWPPPQGTTLILRSLSGQHVPVEVSPLPNSRGAAAVLPLAMVHVKELEGFVRLDLSLTRTAFGLTQAEAEVAAELANGRSSADIARRRGLSVETIHTQVKAILAKTGCARRAGLPSVLRPYQIA
jgi:DNA-binding CsgD family transcriptional regulator